MNEKDFTLDEFSQYYFAAILENFKKENYPMAMQVCDEAYNQTNNQWFQCAKAEIYFASSQEGMALYNYLILLENDPKKLFHSYVSLQIAAIHYRADNFEQLIEIISTSLEKYSATSTKALIDDYLLYQSYVFALIKTGRINSAQTLINSLEMFPCTELEYLKVSLLFENDVTEASILYETLCNRRPFHASNYNTRLLDGPIDRTEAKNNFEICFHDELDASRLLYCQKDDNRNELSFGCIDGDYLAHLKPRKQFFDILSERIQLLSPEMKGIVSIKKVENDNLLIELYHAGDRWYGDYTYFSNWVYWLLNYVKDTQILVSELYENWVDHYQVRNGLPSYCRYHGCDSFYYDELLTYEKIISKNRSNIDLKKIVSNEFYIYGDLGVKKAMKKDVKLEDDIAEYKLSVNMLQKSLKYNPENSKALVTYGKVLFYSSDIENSEVYFEKATRIDPKSFNAWFFRGQIAIRQNNFIKGEYCFKKLIAIQSDHIEVRNLKIKALQILRDIANKNATRLKMSLKSIENILCDLYKKSNLSQIAYSKNLKNSSYAISHLDRALLLIEEKIQNEPYIALHWVEKGNSLFHLQKYDKATAAYKKAIQLGAINKLETINWLSISLGNSEDYNSALDTIDGALELYEKPEDRVLLLGTKAWLHYESGDMQTAFDISEMMLQIQKSYHYPWYIQALIHVQKGSHEMALNCIDNAIALNGEIKKIIREEPEFQKLYGHIRFWNKVR